MVADNATLVLAAERVVTPDGILAPGAVEITGGVITAVRPGGTAVRSGGVRAQPGVLAPGFVDIQVNGIGGVDVATADGADWDDLDAQLVRQGVTAWCPTLITQPLSAYGKELARITAAAATGARPRPAILGAHLEGPFLGGAPGAHNREWLAPIDPAWLHNLPAIVRLITLAPELAGAIETIRDLTQAQITVSLGHSTASYETAVDAAAAGATLVTHCFNGMGPLHHRQPGLLGAALTDARLTVSMIADLVHVHPAAIALAFRAKGPGRVVLVTDAVAWEGRLAIEDGAPRLPDGTLAGSCLTMDVAVANVVNYAAVSLEAALAAASTTPAALLGATDRGRIAVGQRADLVHLDDELRVVATYIGGEQVFSH